jgi:hypothetical protein
MGWLHYRCQGAYTAKENGELKASRGDLLEVPASIEGYLDECVNSA